MRAQLCRIILPDWQQDSCVRSFGSATSTGTGEGREEGGHASTPSTVARGLAGGRTGSRGRAERESANIHEMNKISVSLCSLGRIRRVCRYHVGGAEKYSVVSGRPRTAKARLERKWHKITPDDPTTCPFAGSFPFLA